MSDMSAAPFNETDRPQQAEAPPSAPPKAESTPFEIPAAFRAFETPAAFRALAEQSTSQARDNWEKLKVATDEATGMIEDSYAGASRGAATLGLKLIEMSRANANAAFDYAAALFAVTTISEALELSASHLRRQVETLGEQGKDIAALTQQVTDETTRPIRQGVRGAFKTAA